jgi:glycosyltransferase involved in cell wall biosynthesis
VLRILGTRGVPAAHGGFETFAERFALDLQARGWEVTVYCQLQGRGATVVDRWCGVQRVGIPVALPGPAGTMLFDALAIRHAAARREPCLTLGYNTALWCMALRLQRIPNVINMDGLEWRRAKWGRLARWWLRANEWIGARVGDHLIADHPDIERHLRARGVPAARISMIPYGADRVLEADEAPVRGLGLQPGRYVLVVARLEPENSILEIVQGFVAAPGDRQLVVVGPMDATNAYHRRVREAADARVLFAGALYERLVMRSLRRHALVYAHGHQVGGTNPSLVEALGAGSAVIAHDNRFNRWVAGEAALYFQGPSDFARCLQTLGASPAQLDTLRRAARARFDAEFDWESVLSRYRALFERFLN